MNCLLIPGAQSPRSLPYPCKLLTLSQTAFTAAVMGIASTRPMAPHRVPQNISATVTTKGFKCTRDPTTLGYSKFNAMRCSTATTMAIMTYTPGSLYLINPASSGGNAASGSPTYGTRLKNPLNGPMTGQYGRRMEKKNAELRIANKRPRTKLPIT